MSHTPAQDSDPKEKRLLFRSLVILFAVLAVFWTFYFPYKVENLYRAIPENAILISEHPRLAERWTECAATPLVRGMLNAFGVQDQDIDNVRNNPNIASAVKLFAGRNTVAAYVPRLDLSGRPAWVFTSWAGYRTQPLRWGWLSSKMSDFQKVELGRDRTGWTKSVGTNGGELWLSVAAIRGMMLGCVSSDRTGVRYLVDRVENSAPVAKAFGRIFTHRFHNKTSSVNQETLDRIWFKWQSDALGAKRHYEVECALILRGETGSSCWIKTDFLPKLPDSDNTRKDNIKVMSSMTGDHSDILAVAPADYVEVFVKQWAAWKGTDSLIKAIRKETRNDSTICAAMLKPGFGGRIAGMKICTALVGFQMKDGADGLAVVNRLLDVVNKESKASLIPKREKNITGMISLDSTRPGFLKLFGQEHRPAFVERDGWLILSSSRMALEKLLKEKSTEENKWVRNIDGGTSTYVMADLSAVSDAINGVASVCGIIASAENKKDKAFEMRLQALRAWMHVLGRMGEGNCRVNVSDGTPELQFDFGS